MKHEAPRGVVRPSSEDSAAPEGTVVLLQCLGHVQLEAPAFLQRLCPGSELLLELAVLEKTRLVFF